MTRPENRVIRSCRWCGRAFVAGRATASYCSAACRKAASRAGDGAWDAPDMASPASGIVPPARVSAEDVAGAVVQARGAQATFEAAARLGEPAIRPACRRIAGGIGSALDGEGL